MKITSYKTPIKLVRGKDGQVELTIDDSKRQKISEEQLGDDTQDILTLSKKIGDQNEAQKSMVKATLYANESEKEGFVTFKYLE